MQGTPSGGTDPFTLVTSVFTAKEPIVLGTSSTFTTAMLHIHIVYVQMVHVLCTNGLHFTPELKKRKM